MDSQSSRAPAARHTLQVLSHLAGRRGPVGAAAIGHALGLPRSSVYQLLAVLREEGFVVHFPEERLFGLGVRAVELAFAYNRQDPLARVGKPIIERLVDTTRENAQLAIMDGRDIYYVATERAPHRPSIVARVGVRLPSHATASGLAMLAAMSRDQVDALFTGKGVFPSLTERQAVENRRQLHAELDRTRARGYGVEIELVEEHIATVACPVIDHLGTPVAAVGISYLSWRIDAAQEEAYAALARTAAEELGRRIGAGIPAAMPEAPSEAPPEELPAD